MYKSIRNIPLRVMLLCIPLLGACHTLAPRQSDNGPLCVTSLAPETRQAVVVSAVPEKQGRAVKVLLLERVSSGWERAGAPIEGVAGRNGLAPIAEKHEGDGRTPCGVFPLRRAFGYAPFQTRIEFLVMSKESIWIDDPASPQYNMLVTRPTPARSFELMRRADDLYKYGIVIEYNTDPVVSGAGSAIFFHLWRGPGSSTAGCVAMSEKDMLRLLDWLDPEKHPVAVIGAETSSTR